MIFTNIFLIFLFKCSAGSSTSMEQDMVISMVKKKLDKGINISTVICDEDTTTMSRLRQNVSHSITEMSDKNHIKKT